MDKVLQLLGLAMRARKLVAGEDQVLKAIRSQSVHLVILATDTAKNTEKKVLDKCNTYGVPVYRYGTRDLLGNAIGKAERVVLAIAEPGFARAIEKAFSH